MAPTFSTPPHRPNRENFWQESFYNLDVSALPLHTNSSAMMSVTISIHSGRSWIGIGAYGNSAWATSWESGAPAPYFIDRLPASMNPETSRVNWTLVFPNDSTPNPHLYFADLRQEGVQRNPLDGSMAIVPPWVSTVDKHAVLWSESSNELMEAIQYSGFSPDAMAITTWNLASYTLPMTVGGGPAGVVAARIPVAPFAYTYQDLLDCGASGELGHMLGVVFGNYGTGVVWPARASDGEVAGAPPAGTVLRLKSSYDLNTLPNDATKALGRTLQTRGMMIFDKTGTDRAGLFSPSDPAWPSGFASSLAEKFQFTDFEIVDLASVAGPTNSIQVTEGATPPPGPTGASGASGATGSSGSSGAVIFTGPTGTPTPSGPTGPSLPTFQGVTGPTIGYAGTVTAFPPSVSGGGRKGWVLYDPTLPESDTNPYTLPTNPFSDQGSFNIVKGVNYEVQGAAVYRDLSGTLRTDSTLIHPAVQEQRTFSFEGNVYREEELTTLQAWVDKGHQVLLRDDLGRVFYIFFTDLKPSRTRSRNRMKHSYTISGLVLAEIEES